MKQSSRVLMAGRWLAGESNWPLVAGVTLGLLATVETVIRTDGSWMIRPIALLLGLFATVPLALAPRHPRVAALTITASTFLTALVYRWGPTATGVLAVLAIWFIVIRARTRRLRAEADEREFSRRALEDTLLEMTARGERARIARELHDVVAHHISMISVQAETARLTSPGMSEDGAMRLRAIGETARTALTEMRRLLGVLREEPAGEPMRQPQPGLQQLLELIDETRTLTGTSTRLIVRGPITTLDPGVELTAYRIVQEALTNARRHAPGAAVDVEIHYVGDALHVRVRDNGPGPRHARGAAANAATGGQAGQGRQGAGGRDGPQG
ncbi:sensor histidine kinase, partial [Nonomuraea lactucae]|uniref:sensor histidine kinase n=1 Tax=Nonomuraea lactucae TaxID=2249762 RepID=UPI001F063C48